MAVAKALTEHRRTEVIELVAAGHSFDDIAQLLGYANRSGPYRLYRKVLADRQDTAVSEHRAMELQRLDAVQSGLWDKAIDGDVEAATAVLQIIQQRCRLLGLEQPTWATRKPVNLVPPEFVEQYTRVLDETREGNREAAGKGRCGRTLGIEG